MHIHSFQSECKISAARQPSKRSWPLAALKQLCNNNPIKLWLVKVLTFKTKSKFWSLVIFTLMEEYMRENSALNTPHVS